MEYQLIISDKTGEVTPVSRHVTEVSGRSLEHHLTVSDKANESARIDLVNQLSAYNQSKAGKSGSRLLTVLIHDQDGGLLGGLWGSTGYNWLCTHLLVIPETMRNRGLGRQIMHYAEREAVARGCHSAWVDTYEFQARRFYERLGYECFGELKDYPLGFSRYFMKKRIMGT